MGAEPSSGHSLPDRENLDLLRAERRQNWEQNSEFLLARLRIGHYVLRPSGLEENQEGRDVAENVTPANQGARKWTDYVTRKRVIGVIIVIAALLFIFQNTQTGEFHFLFFNIKAPRWLWLLGVFAAGYATRWLFERHRSPKAQKSE